MPDTGPMRADELTEWMQLSESLLRGIVHALNNRLTAISAFVELAGMGDEDFEVQRALTAEMVRLHEVGALFRLLVTDESGDEAMEIGPVVDEALALHVHHPTLRGVQCTVVRTGASPTVRAPRWALLRLLLVMLESGKSAADEAGRDVAVLRVDSDEEWVVLRIEGMALTPYGAAMARACGASPDTRAGSAVVRLPTLLELRRRERLARG